MSLSVNARVSKCPMKGADESNAITVHLYFHRLIMNDASLKWGNKIRTFNTDLAMHIVQYFSQEKFPSDK